jgi:methylated-DNA-protein-cysteine methyltransferase-like protein
MSIVLPDRPGFYALVWEIVKQVPAGRVTTFSQVASMIPPPEGVKPEDYAKLGARWVGDALNRVSLVDDPNIPWHRVINVRGTSSLPENSEGAALQRGRLRAEGVMPPESEAVDLAVYGWEGPDSAWLAQRDLLPPKPIKPPPDDGDAPSQMRLF